MYIVHDALGYAAAHIQTGVQSMILSAELMRDRAPAS